MDYTHGSRLNLEATTIDEWLDEQLHEHPAPDGISIIAKLAAGVTIPLDRDRFRRCLINVINNASECMMLKHRAQERSHKDGEDKQLTVESRMADARLKICVIDTGPGIPPDERDKIFEPLYSTKSFGADLGLPITKQIMEQHGGGIEIQSEPGQGTIVTLWLPGVTS